MAKFQKVPVQVWLLFGVGVALLIAGQVGVMVLPKPGSQASGGFLRSAGIVSLGVALLDAWFIGVNGSAMGLPRIRAWAVALAILTHAGGLIYARRYVLAALLLSIELAACAVWQVSLKARLAADAGYGFESALFLYFAWGAAAFCAVICWKFTRVAPAAPGASLSPSSG